MFSLEYSNQFKKDFKKIIKLPIADIVEVGNVISTLQKGEQLAPK
jgi:mRNA interferase YafQ